HRRLYEHLRRKAKELPETVEEMAPLYAAVVYGCLAGKRRHALDHVYWKRISRERQNFNSKRLGAFSSEAAVLSAFFTPPWERLAPGLREVDQPMLLNNAGFALRALGRLSAAMGLFRMAVNRNIARKNWSEAANSVSNLSELLQVRGELNEALVQARKGVELADKSGDGVRRLYERTTLAAVLHAMGLWEEAAAQFDDAERMQNKVLTRQVGFYSIKGGVGRSRAVMMQPPWLHLYALQGFRYCDLLHDQGRIDEVRERAENALAWCGPNVAVLDIALDERCLGRAHAFTVQRSASGGLAQAEAHLQKAVAGLRHAGYLEHLPLGLLARASLRTRTRNFLDARRDLDEALTLATRCGFRLHECDAHLGLARLALAEGNFATAVDHLARGHQLIEETGYHRRDGELAELEAEAAEMVKTAPPPPAATAHVPLPPPPAPTPTKSMPEQPTKQHVDVGIVIALPEELREFLALSGSYARHQAADLDSYLFTRGPYRCAVTLVGEMGETQAGMFTERLISSLDPGIILSMGIAGGVNDLLAGDVHVP